MIETAYHAGHYNYMVKLLSTSFDDSAVFCTTESSDGSKISCSIHAYEGGYIRVRFGLPEEHSVCDIDSILKKSLLVPVEDNETRVVLKAGSCHIILQKDPWLMRVEDFDGNPLLVEEPGDMDPVDKRQMKPAGYNLADDNRITGCNLCFSLSHDEHFFGFGESFTSFDKRGQSVDIWNIDALGVRNDEAYKNIPFFISTKGYGFFLNHAAASQFQMGSESIASWQVHAEGLGIDYLLIPGVSADQILQKYTALTGRAPMLPLWSFGTWVSNGFYNADRDSMMETAQKLIDEKIPADVLHFDCYWLRDRKWCDFTWDTNRFPEPEQMLSQLKLQGYHTCLWINPYISIESDMYVEGVKRKFFLKNADGSVLIRDVWHGLEPECAFIDFTSEEEVSWYRQKLASLIDMGVSVLKTDFGEDIPEEACYANGMSGKEMHNLYSLLYNRTVFELIREKTGDGIVWGRSGYAGSQRYPVCWSGDPATSFPAMAAVLRGGLSYGISGIPFWSHDIGGFYGDAPDPELYVRWAQFGLFSSHARCHGTTSRDPWNYGIEALRIFRKYVQLRYSLLPYISNEAKICTETGLPFIRPMWISTFDDPTCWNIDDQYFFGSEMLIAPMLEPGTKRNIYLPEGRWIDFNTKEVLSGSCWLSSYEVPLDTLPIFVREGAVVPRLFDYAQNTGEINWDSSLYFEQYGDSTKTPLRWFSPVLHVWIELSREDQVLSDGSRSYRLEHIGKKKGG